MTYEALRIAPSSSSAFVASSDGQRGSQPRAVQSRSRKSGTASAIVRSDTHAGPTGGTESKASASVAVVPDLLAPVKVLPLSLEWAADRSVWHPFVPTAQRR